jgi:hypothetical protein
VSTPTRLVLLLSTVLLGCRDAPSRPATTARWEVIFAAPGDTLFLDRASIVKVSGDTVRSWMRSTRAGSVTREETACLTRRTRSVAAVPDSLRSATPVALGNWEEVAPGTRAEKYLDRVCSLAGFGD